MLRFYELSEYERMRGQKMTEALNLGSNIGKKFKIKDEDELANVVPGEVEVVGVVTGEVVAKMEPYMYNQYQDQAKSNVWVVFKYLKSTGKYLVPKNKIKVAPVEVFEAHI